MAFVGIALSTSCTSDMLETTPTTSVSADGVLKSATTAMTPLNGIYRSMYTAGWTTTGNTHQAFGISAYAIMADVMGEDFVQKASGSGWFWYDCVYDVKDAYRSSSWRSYDLWNAYYGWIANANYIIAAHEEMEGTEADVSYVVGNAYAIRAYSYYGLAEMFARTYIGHENDPCVPIYTEPTSKDTQGQPRSTVKAVYERITEDINKAVELLEKNKSNSDPSHLDYYAAHGIRARIALTMNEWDTAAKSAEIARSASIIGSKDDLMGGMNDVSKGNVIWGAAIKDDQSGMYAGFFTHLDADADKYGASAPKVINTQLYALMGENDVRRGWWDVEGDPAYQQEKFKFADKATWTGDYIWMRAEEMLLIQAEAACRLGQEDRARELLMELMSKRDEDYEVKKTGKDLGALTTDMTGSLLEEIIIQRRIELWGEYGRIFDIRRLKQGFKRTEAMGWAKSALIEGTNTWNPESYAWVMTIPQAEFDGNINMEFPKDQNPVDDGI